MARPVKWPRAVLHGTFGSFEIKSFSREFDVIVVGAGHAGIEAAWISASFGLKICLVTMESVSIASMPCNPSIGGVGKGQVVREVDALGGIMGKLADMSGMQYRVLNDSKGYAVRSTRVQADKYRYSKKAKELLESNSNIKIEFSCVDKITKEGDLFVLGLNSKEGLTSKKLIVTTGTFLNGVTHVGREKKREGAINCESSKGIKEIIEGVKIPSMRFKTGTPPRLNRDTIDFSYFIEQESSEFARNFHSLNSSFDREVEQVSCFLARTNEETLSIIRENKASSPLFNGQIKGVGPRYCPSIEDKAFRYPDRNSHHIFIEPEGVDSKSIYPSGMSTSLPKEVQKQFFRTISGMEQVEIITFGYAVEYDVIDTTKLKRTLEYLDLPGLFFAGQVNGTSGYEEAAGQGIIAGINASLSLLGKDPLVLSRSDSYIGVLIEDLVSNVRDEPYRLFTARAENRLYIREDNTTERMYKYRSSLKLGHELDSYQDRFMKESSILHQLCKKTIYKSNKETQSYFEKMEYGNISSNVSLSELLKRSKLDPVKTLKTECRNMGARFLEDVVTSCAVSEKYEGYINRASQESEKLVKLGKKKINWERLVESSNISNECKQRLEKIRPESFSELQRIEGIRPATLAYVAGTL